MPYILVETMLLLTSSFTYGVGMLYVHKGEKNIALALIGITFLLGLGFIGMELNEFIHLVHEGNSWQRSGFLSAFFTLVGTHGLHVTCGLIWMASLMVQVARNGVTTIIKGKLTCLGLFWHFLDIVWIFVFTNNIFHPFLCCSNRMMYKGNWSPANPANNCWWQSLRQRFRKIAKFFELSGNASFWQCGR